MQQRPSAPILPLTTVRFFAALYVVLLHSATWSGHLDVSTWIGRFFRAGYTAVGFFFLLSGYILAHVYLNTGRSFDKRQFLISRFARAYPLLFVSLLLDLPNALLLRLHLLTVKAAIVKTSLLLIAESLLLQSWSSHFRGINAPSWSLSAEAVFYLAFPLAALWIWRRTSWRALLLVLSFWGCAMLAPVLVTAARPSLFVENDASALQWAVELMPIFRIFEFFAGISLCSLQRAIEGKLDPGRRSQFGYLFVAIAGLIFVLVIQFSNRIPLLVMTNGLLLPASSLLILGLANVRGWLAFVLSHKWLVILGEASYAVYLLHDPLWLYVSRIHAIDSLLAWFAYLAIVLAAGIASFYLLERPARKFILARARIRPRVLQDQEAVARA